MSGGGQGITPRPCPYLARAWWGDQLVAESTSAVLVERPGSQPELYFPLEDVRLHLLQPEQQHRSGEPSGPTTAWSIGEALAEAVPAAREAAEWGDPEPVRFDGAAILRRHDDPSPGPDWPSGLAAFDHQRVRVEVVDAPGDGADDGRDVTVKRFPVWGDTSHLVDLLDVRPDTGGSFVSVARTSPRRPVVEGSQMLAQAIVAAGRRAPGRRVVSAHMVFMRAADAGGALRFDLDELSSGRTLSTFSVHVQQAGRLCAAGTLLLDVTAPDLIRHAAAARVIPGPYECHAYDMSVMGRDIRVAEVAYTDDPEAPVGPPVIDAWVRFHEVPDDPYLHTGLLAQFTGHMSIAAALRPHPGIGQRAAHRTVSTAINAIAISFHADVRADRWMLYHHESTFAGDGMTHSQCRVHDEHGGLLASFTVDAMVRRFAAGSEAVDDRTAL